MHMCIRYYPFIEEQVYCHLSYTPCRRVLPFSPISCPSDCPGSHACFPCTYHMLAVPLSKASSKGSER